MSGAAAGLKPGPNAGARESKGAAIAPSICVFGVGPRRLARNAPLTVHGLPQPQVVAPDIPGVAAQMIKLWR